MGRIALLLLALFAEMERTFTAERAANARAVAKTGIPRTSLHRYLTDTDAVADPR